MDKKIVDSITSKILALQDKNGCWNVLDENHKYFPAFNYYAPNFKSTLWTLILLADVQTDHRNDRFKKPLSIISDHFLDKQLNIYSLGKSHFPIPCLNGNMLYLHSYYHFEKNKIVENIIDFFAEYQRFDDGDFRTPSSFPYCSNHSCYGKHTCYWGIIKLFKGLSFIPESKRSENAKSLIKKCIDFILLHQVCFSSHDTSKFIHSNIKLLTFPNMYRGDYLEILWLLKREQVQSTKITRALDLLKSRKKPDATWEIEHPLRNLIIPVDNRHYGKELITERAREVTEYYSP